MSAGAFPMPHTRDLLAEVRWTFEPYVRARPSLSKLDAVLMREVIRDVHHRISPIAPGHYGMTTYQAGSAHAEEIQVRGIYSRTRAMNYR